MSDFGFVGAAYTAESPTQDDQELINWYCETDPTKNAGTKAMGVSGDRGVTALYPCPGLNTLVTPVAGVQVRGLYVRPGLQYLYAVCGNTLYEINVGWNATAKGTLASNAGQVKITSNSTALYITDGSGYRYAYAWGTGTFSTVTDGGFTGGTFCDVIDNFIIYNKPDSVIWGCTDVGSIVSNALNTGSKVGTPDYIKALIADHQEVWLIGEKTVEVWDDAGLQPFPFQQRTGAVMQHGIVAPYSLSRFGESTCWLSQDDRGQGVAVMANGYSPVRISTHAVENDIKDGVISDAIGFTYQQNGHEFWMLTFPTQDKTWCFDLATGLWHKRAWRDSYNVLHRHRANCCASFNGKIVVGDYENGKIYELSLTTYTDAGDTIARIRRAPHIVSDLNNQFFHRLQIQCQAGVGNTAYPNPQASIAWSNNGGRTFNDPVTVEIGATGDYGVRALWTGLGMARDRVFQLTVTDPVFACVVSANLDMSPGAT